MEIEVNGVRYTLKPQPPRKKHSKFMMMSVMMAGMTNIYGGGGSVPKPLFSLDNWLIEEFKRIQNKESKLSRTERDRVEQSFYKYFQKT